MSKILSLLSGKGGSGKTTVALSISAMLSSCGIKVLLIDCDLSTNGATYFYESKISEQEGRIESFYNLVFDNYEKTDNLRNNYKETDNLININKNMDFMPSIIHITKNNTDSYIYNEKSKEFFLKKIKKDYCSKYDVIIFDCQAGYTDVLKLILPIVDINLIVMEADAISSSSIRSLYLKIGDLLNDKKLYQIFNKVSNDDYETYSKISGGTVFTNIETVVFDWKIKKAFSVAEIPDMENTSARYGVQIYNICKILFKEKNIQSKLAKYGLTIEINEKKEEEEKLEYRISVLQDNSSSSRKKKNKRITSLTPILMMLSLCLASLSYTNLLNEDKSIIAYIVQFCLISLSLIFTLFMLIDDPKERKLRQKEIVKLEDELEYIESKRKELQTNYDLLNTDIL